MVEFAYMRVVNHVNSKYFSVISHPTMVYNKVLVDDECLHNILTVFGNEKKIIEEFSFHKSMVLSTHIKKTLPCTVYH